MQSFLKINHAATEEFAVHVPATAKHIASEAMAPRARQLLQSVQDFALLLVKAALKPLNPYKAWAGLPREHRWTLCALRKVQCHDAFQEQCWLPALFAAAHCQLPLTPPVAEVPSALSGDRLQ